MQIKQTLEQFGLTGRKADVYIATLELGSGTTIEIANKAGIKRTTCYDILLDLIKMGFVYETAKEKKRIFVAEDPEKIKDNLRRKEKIFEDMMPELKSIYNIKGVKPKIRFYEGKSGLKEVYEDTLKYGAGIMQMFASEDAVKALGTDWAEDYIRRRVETGLKVKAIMPATEIIKKSYVAVDQAHLRESKLVDPVKYPFTVEINIYGQSVAMMSSREETGVIIEGTEIHKTLKLIFNLLWDSLA